MVELGQLEKQYQKFAAHQIRIVVISNDDQPTAQETQHDFPHLIVVADTDQALAKTLEVLDLGAGPKLSDTNAPTTFLVNGKGIIDWYFRPTNFIERLSPDELLAAIEKTWGKK